ncbi:MAG TPA: hypothetical protein VFK14_08680 [Solirubrobacterales bacterium]|nr:hypothetical protein [Solirubrobacterales bacterium]
MAEPKNYGRLATGELLTDELIEKLSKEAEKGWEVEELLTWRQVDQNPPPASDARPRSGPPRRPR